MTPPFENSTGPAKNPRRERSPQSKASVLEQSWSRGRSFAHTHRRGEPPYGGNSIASKSGHRNVVKQITSSINAGRSSATISSIAPMINDDSRVNCAKIHEI